MGIKSNIVSADRIIRALGGAILAAVGIATLVGTLEFGTAAGAVALLIGGILLVTALARICPAYRLVDVGTCETA